MSVYSAHTANYQQAMVMSSSREELVVLLYRHLLANLRRAAKEIAARDIEGKAESLSKAADIVFELLGSLDFEAGGEFASRLASLYEFYLHEIHGVGRTLDTDRLERLIALIAELHEGWSEAARRVRHAGVASRA